MVYWGVGTDADHTQGDAVSQYAGVMPQLVAAVQSPDNVVSSHIYFDRLYLVFRDGSVAACTLDGGDAPTWQKVIAGPEYSKLFND